MEGCSYYYYLLFLYTLKYITLCSVRRKEHLWNFCVLQRVHLSTSLFLDTVMYKGQQVLP